MTARQRVYLDGVLWLLAAVALLLAPYLIL